MAPDNDPFLTRVEAAALMHLSPRTLANLASSNPPQGPAYMKTAALRGKTLYRRSAVVAYLEANGGGAGRRASDKPSQPAKPRQIALEIPSLTERQTNTSPRRRKAGAR
jgi:hypothetical protein